MNTTPYANFTPNDAGIDVRQLDDVESDDMTLEPH